jgi:hypothetical protein
VNVRLLPNGDNDAALLHHRDHHRQQLVANNRIRRMASVKPSMNASLSCKQ